MNDVSLRHARDSDSESQPTVTRSSTPPSGKTPKKSTGRGSSPRSLSGARYRDSSSGGYSDTGGAIRSDDDSESIRYSSEYSKHDAITAPSQKSSLPACSQQDPGSPNGTFNVDSPGAQTLASLKQEAMQAKRQRSRNQQGRFTTSSGKVPNTTRECRERARL